LEPNKFDDASPFREEAIQRQAEPAIALDMWPGVHRRWVHQENGGYRVGPVMVNKDVKQS